MSCPTESSASSSSNKRPNIRRRRPTVCSSLVATTLFGTLLYGLVPQSYQHSTALQWKRNAYRDADIASSAAASLVSSDPKNSYSSLQTSYSLLADPSATIETYNRSQNGHGDHSSFADSNQGISSIATISSSHSKETKSEDEATATGQTAVVMAAKKHSPTDNKKEKRSNAVGDPDGNSSDDDDEEDDLLSSSDTEEDEHETHPDLEEFMKKTALQMKEAAHKLVQGFMVRHTKNHIQHTPNDTLDNTSNISKTNNNNDDDDDHDKNQQDTSWNGLLEQDPWKEDEFYQEMDELNTSITQKTHLDVFSSSATTHEIENLTTDSTNVISSQEDMPHYSHEIPIHVDMEILSSVSSSSSSSSSISRTHIHPSTNNVSGNHHDHTSQHDSHTQQRPEDILFHAIQNKEDKLQIDTTTNLEDSAIIEKEYRGGASSGSVQSHQTIDELIQVSSQTNTFSLTPQDGDNTFESTCIVLSNEGNDDKGNDDPPDSTSSQNNTQTTVLQDVRNQLENQTENNNIYMNTKDDFDQALIDAFLPILFLPPPASALECMKKNASTIDIESRRRLDRRTLYQALLLELTHAGMSSDTSKTRTDVSTKTGGESTLPWSTRRYLDAATSRNLRGAVSLASQPRWRRHILVSSQMNTTESILGNNNDNNQTEVKENSIRISPWWWQGGIRLYSTEEEDEIEQYTSEASSSQQTATSNGPGMMGMWGTSPTQEEDEEASSENQDKGQTNMLDGNLPTTMSMQETVAMALAHSLNCGLALIDDEAISSVRQTLLDNQSLGLNSESLDIRPVTLLGHLLRLCNEGKIPTFVCKFNSKSDKCGRISNRMNRDIRLGLDDPHDETALDSLRLLREEENIWYTKGNESSDTATHANTSTVFNKKPLPLILFLRSDTSTSLLKSRSFVERMARECVSADSIHTLMLGKGIDASTTTLPGAGKYRLENANNPPFSSHRRAFVKKDDSTPTANPSIAGPNNPFASFSNMPPGMTMPTGDISHSHHSINASGINDPEGSRRFNIFLARTMDKDGKPGIIGAIAPPSAGNLFPQILAFQARKNLIQSQMEGDSPEKQQQFEEILQRWTEIMEQQRVGGNENSSPPQFFNATFGLNTDASNSLMTPPEVIQRAIEEAVSQVMEQFASFHLKDVVSSDTEKGSLPPHLTKAFAQILQNESLRRGIAENLARAAPALVDPRCQGVMLSVYVPPGPDHPNFGLMPGQQKTSKSSDSKKQSDRKYTNADNKDGIHAPPGMTGWLNKILSSSNSKTESASDTSEEDPSTNVRSQDDEGHEEESVAVSDSNDTPKDNSLVTDSWRQNERKAAISAATELLSTIQLKNSIKKTSDPKEYVKSTQTAEQKAQKHLTRLQALCKSIPLRKPQDPVRSRSWAAWAVREHGCIVFRKNRRELQESLLRRNLGLRMNTGTKGLGTRIRQMLSLKDISTDMDEVIKCAVEIEAARSQRLKV